MRSGLGTRNRKTGGEELADAKVDQLPRVAVTSPDHFQVKVMSSSRGDFEESSVVIVTLYWRY